MQHAIQTPVGVSVCGTVCDLGRVAALTLHDRAMKMRVSLFFKGDKE